MKKIYIILILMSAILVACDTPFNPIPNGRNYYNNLVFAEDVLSQTHTSLGNPEEVYETIYLSDMNWESASPGTKKDASAIDTPLTINGKMYQKGIGTRPYGHRISEVVYNLGGLYQEFMADVGIDDSTVIHATVLFEVLGDGRILKSSSTLFPDSEIEHLSVNIAGINQLTLRTRNLYGEPSDGNWADARVGGSRFVTYVSDMPWEEVHYHNEDDYGIRPPMPDRTIRGLPLKLNGIEYQKGITAHADTEITINLHQAMTGFIADIGISDEVNDELSDVSVLFKIFLDGHEVYASPSLTPASPPLNVNISGIKADGTMADRMALRVLPDGKISHDIGIWADARIYTISPIPRYNRMPPPRILSITTSDELLTTKFQERITEALGYVRTGTQNTIPSIAAAIVDRGSFALRDITHMAVGAHYLGLKNDMFSMFKAMAEKTNLRIGTNDEYRHPWHITFSGDEQDAAHVVPAVYDFVRTSYIMYRLTGDDTWITDPVLLAHYEYVMDRYLTLHDNYSNNGIADAEGGHFVDTPSFYEFSDYNVEGHHINESADGIGMQYQATLAYAEILRARNQIGESMKWRDEADRVLNIFRRDFQDGNSYYAGRVFIDDGVDGESGTADDNFTYISGWNKEASILMPATFLTEPGIKTDEYLNLIQQNYKNINIEAQTYVPEAFYPYGKTEKGWEALQYLIDHESTYPEVSYTIIGNTIRYVIGLDRSADGVVRTLPQLPQKLSFIEVTGVSIGHQRPHIRHTREEGTLSTSFYNRNEQGPMRWEPRFIGRYGTARVESSMSPGRTITGEVRQINNVDITVFETVRVGTGESVTVTVPTQ